jgi:leucyl aminopeptidase
MAKVQIQKAAKDQADRVLLINGAVVKASEAGISEYEAKYVNARFKSGENLIEINNLSNRIYFYFIEIQTENWKQLENCRVAGSKICKQLNEHKIIEVELLGVATELVDIIAFAEGMALANYQFLKYFSDKSKKKNTLQRINIVSSEVNDDAVEELNILNEAVFNARDLVNEPACFLTAEDLAGVAKKIGKQNGIKVEVLNEMKIESLRMGGLLAVNQGAENPPTFTIMEYKPKNAVNKQPYVLVGKGVVFDTGGVNIKTQNMELMKADMGGAATVIGAISAIARQKLPSYVIALIPATENRPGGNAYLPGDVITMFDGTTVEVLNTDAEGRLILADALAYAKKFKPELVIDIATLTGAALRTLGMYGMPMMGNAPEHIMNEFKKISYQVYERAVEFPLWDEYLIELKSTIADLKNIGNGYAGHITAAKFLQHFTCYPWIHLDIAGPSFFEKEDAYRLYGGSGYGVRLLYHFIKEQTKVNRKKK